MTCLAAALGELSAGLVLTSLALQTDRMIELCVVTRGDEVEDRLGESGAVLIIDLVFLRSIAIRSCTLI